MTLTLTVIVALVVAIGAGLLFRMYATCAFNTCEWHHVINVLPPEPSEEPDGVWQCARCKSICIGRELR